MFDERTFVTQKQRQWQDLTLILDRVKNDGLRTMPAGDLARLGSLYRRAAADLAYARTQRATAELIFYLNELVGQGHGILYQESRGRPAIPFLADFFARDLPDTLRRNTPFIFFCFVVSLVAGVIAADLIRHNPTNISLFLPQEFKSSFDAWKQGFADKGTVSPGQGAMFSSFLMTHNASVGLISFALGITTVIPLAMLFQNGAMMGALVAVVAPTGHSVTMWAGLLPHGVCELSALFIDAGAGLMIGWALIHPGRLSRREALLRNSKEAVKMMMGTAPLYIIAGLIEGNVSHAALPHVIKFGFAAIQLAALLTYIYGNWYPRTGNGMTAAAY